MTTVIATTTEVDPIDTAIEKQRATQEHLQTAHTTRQSAKAQEPSMEEILASIRRVISDDDAGKRGDGRLQNRNGWPASIWNAWPASSESAP